MWAYAFKKGSFTAYIFSLQQHFEMKWRRENNENKFYTGLIPGSCSSKLKLTLADDVDEGVNPQKFIGHSS